METTDNIINSFCVALEKNGWIIKKTNMETSNLPECINRYNKIPTEYTRFLSGIRSCTNSDETVWMLGTEDFGMQADAFKWNEFEIISLQAAADAEDKEWKARIKDFWNHHLPFCLSVKGGYSYYAIRMEDGIVVRGAEPEFEETTETAASFREFMEMVCRKEISL